MNGQLLDWMIGIHAAVAPLAFVAMNRYADRKKLLDDVVGRLQEVEDKIRRQLVAECERLLVHVLEPRVEVSIELPAVYRERYISPIGSEELRSALEGFLAKNYVGLGKYSRIRGSSREILAWTRRSSWATLLLMMWQVAALGTLVGFGKLGGIDIADGLLGLSALPTAALVITFFVCKISTTHHQDVVDDCQEQ